MKKIFKIFVNVFAVMLCAIAAITFTACRDIKTVEVNFSVYNYTDSKYEDHVLTVDLYRHLAPKTVDNVISAIEDGYYDGALLYQLVSAGSQLMVGEYKADGTNIVKQADRPTVEGEFSANGLSGSNLVNKKGYIGLWRSYTKDAGTFTKSDSGRNSGSAVWYIPTATISNYDGYFAVFAKVDMDSDANTATYTALQTIFTNSDYYELYDVFYTVGEGDALTLYMIKSSDLEDDDKYDEDAKTYDGQAIFEAKGSDLVSMNMHKIRLPAIKNGKRNATVTSIKLK